MYMGRNGTRNRPYASGPEDMTTKYPMTVTASQKNDRFIFHILHKP